MNQVHSELQLARGLIDERDSEIQRIRVSNNQVCCLAIKGSSAARFFSCLESIDCLVMNMLNAVY
jgi:hypothetical protein